MKLKNATILITGGAGFIGTNLCERLLGQNNVIRCLDNLSTGKRSNIQPFMDHPNFHFTEGDIVDMETCREATKNCDYVLHHAALGSVPRSIEKPLDTVHANINGHLNVLQASVENKVKRFVYAASSAVYGDREELPKKEHLIGKALSPYAISKYVDELFSENFSKLYGIETIGLRYFNVFGKYQDPDGPYSAVMPKFIKSLIRHESPVINGDGSFSRDFTHVENVIHANEMACLTDFGSIVQRRKEYYSGMGLPSDSEVTAEVLNIAAESETSLNELVQWLKSMLISFDPAIEHIEPIHGPERSGDIPHSLASVDKARALINYNPEVSVENGLKKTIEWYFNNLK